MSEENFETKHKVAIHKKKQIKNQYIKNNDKKIKNKEADNKKIKKNKETDDINNQKIRYIILLISLFIVIFLIIFEIIYIGFIHEKNKNTKVNCNSGFFMPEDEKSNKNCKKCRVNNCEKCLGNKTLDFCLNCKSGYKPIYENENGIIKYCYFDNEEYENCLLYNDIKNECEFCNADYFLAQYSETKKKCRICSIENCIKCFGSTLSHLCINCKSGYFVPSDDKYRQRCQKCTVNNCEKCVGIRTYDICYSCYPGFNPIYDNSIIIKCSCKTGENEFCLTCNDDNGECKDCNKGYFLPTDADNKYQCQKCSDENCEECSGTISLDICKKCKKDYQFLNGKCEIINVITATYNTLNDNENITLMNRIQNVEIISEFIDGENISKIEYSHLFKNNGTHEAIFILNLQNSDSFNDMFKNIYNLVTIHFTNFYSENIKTMMNMFQGCKSLISFNFSELSTQNLKNTQYMFQNCPSLESVDISNITADNLENMSFMFHNCISLTSFDLSNFHFPKLKRMNVMFQGCSSLTFINISNFQGEMVTTIDHMFYGCSRLTSLDFSTFIIDKVNDMAYLLFDCYNLNFIDISSFKEFINMEFDYPMNNTGEIIINNEWEDYIKYYFPKMNITII